MPKFVYRKISLDFASRIMDWADKEGVDYDIWNAEDLFCGLAETAELGLEDWTIWFEDIWIGNT